LDVLEQYFTAVGGQLEITVRTASNKLALLGPAKAAPAPQPQLRLHNPAEDNAGVPRTCPIEGPTAVSDGVQGSTTGTRKSLT
jgi:hypothetical protein